MGRYKLLLIEGNNTTRSTLELALSRKYEVDATSSGIKCLNVLVKNEYDLIITDTNVEDIKAEILVEKIRTIGINVPIFVLSNDDSLNLKIGLFKLGVNDFITKPFNFGELDARVEAALNRLAKISEENKVLKTNNLVLNLNTHTVTRDGHIDVALRKKEFAILEYMMINAGQIVSRKSIANYAWDDNKPWSNSVDVHIKSLRDKLDRPFKTNLIKTVHGYGYQLVSQK